MIGIKILKGFSKKFELTAERKCKEIKILMLVA